MKFLKHIPGIILSAVIAFLACWIENILPIHLIGSAVIAMFIGMLLNHFLHNTTLFSDGLKFTSKKNIEICHYITGAFPKHHYHTACRKNVFNCHDFYITDLFWWRVFYR